MKYYLSIAAVSVMTLILLTSCGGKGNSQSEENEVIELKPATEVVSGELEDCFIVVDRTYKVKLEEFIGGVLTVELKRTDMPLPFDSENRILYSIGTFSASSYVQVGFGIELLDAEGNVVDKTSASSGSYSPSEAVELVKLSDGKTGTIRFSIGDEAKDAVSFRITSTYIYGGSDNPSDVSDSYSIENDDDDDDAISNAHSSSYNLSETKSKTSGKSENWDSVLDSYEKFVNKYIAFYKKVKNGSVSMSSPEYSEYLQESLEFSEKLSNAESEMTTSQIIRLNKIAAKLAETIE